MSATCLQDCSLIIAKFEEAAHADLSEASVFATMAKHIETTRNNAKLLQGTMSSYLYVPEEKDLEDKATVLDNVSYSVNANKLLNTLKKCIPCDGRLISAAELFPSLSLMGVLEKNLLNDFALLNNLTDLLNDTTFYNDYCALIDALSFMCIPDLQKILALLIINAQFEFPELDLSFDFILNLIAPLFTPILLSMTAMFDQFALIILSPIECIITNINYQIQKLDIKDRVEELSQQAAQSRSQNIALANQINDEDNDTTVRVPEESKGLNTFTNSLKSLTSSLEFFRDTLIESKEMMQAKLDFYIEQAMGLLGDASKKSYFHINLSFKKLKLVKLIGLVAAIIKGLESGLLTCSSSSNRSANELEKFINTFLNTATGHVLSLDPDGNIVISNRQGQDDNTGGVEISAEPIINDPELTQAIEELQGKLTYNQAKVATIPCKIKTQSGTSDKINKWIRELQSS